MGVSGATTGAQSAEGTELRVPGAARMRLGGRGAMKTGPEAGVMAADAAGAGLTAASVEGTSVVASNAAEERGRAVKLAEGGREAAWPMDDGASEWANKRAAGETGDAPAWGERAAWASCEGLDGRESRAKKFAAESVADSGVVADENKSGEVAGRKLEIEDGWALGTPPSGRSESLVDSDMSERKERSRKGKRRRLKALVHEP